MFKYIIFLITIITFHFSTQASTDDNAVATVTGRIPLIGTTCEQLDVQRYHKVSTRPACLLDLSKPLAAASLPSAIDSAKKEIKHYTRFETITWTDEQAQHTKDTTYASLCSRTAIASSVEEGSTQGLGAPVDLTTADSIRYSNHRDQINASIRRKQALVFIKLNSSYDRIFFINSCSKLELDAACIISSDNEFLVSLTSNVRTVSLVHLCIHRGDQEALKAALKAGAQCTHIVQNPFDDRYNKETVLHALCTRGTDEFPDMIELIKSILDINPSLLDMQRGDGRTAAEIVLVNPNIGADITVIILKLLKHLGSKYDYQKLLDIVFSLRRFKKQSTLRYLKENCQMLSAAAIQPDLQSFTHHEFCNRKPLVCAFLCPIIETKTTVTSAPAACTRLRSVEKVVQQPHSDERSKAHDQIIEQSNASLAVVQLIAPDTDETETQVAEILGIQSSSALDCMEGSTKTGP